jgi:hypothetical protein
LIKVIFFLYLFAFSSFSQNVSEVSNDNKREKIELKKYEGRSTLDLSLKLDDKIAIPDSLKYERDTSTDKVCFHSRNRQYSKRELKGNSCKLGVREPSFIEGVGESSLSAIVGKTLFDSNVEMAKVANAGEVKELYEKGIYGSKKACRSCIGSSIRGFKKKYDDFLKSLAKDQREDNLLDLFEDVQRKLAFLKLDKRTQDVEEPCKKLMKNLPLKCQEKVSSYFKKQIDDPNSIFGADFAGLDPIESFNKFLNKSDDNIKDKLDINYDDIKGVQDLAAVKKQYRKNLRNSLKDIKVKDIDIKKMRNACRKLKKKDTSEPFKNFVSPLVWHYIEENPSLYYALNDGLCKNLYTREKKFLFNSKTIEKDLAKVIHDSVLELEKENTEFSSKKIEKKYCSFIQEKIEKNVCAEDKEILKQVMEAKAYNINTDKTVVNGILFRKMSTFDSSLVNYYMCINRAQIEKAYQKKEELELVLAGVDDITHNSISGGGTSSDIEENTSLVNMIDTSIGFDHTLYPTSENELISDKNLDEDDFDNKQDSIFSESNNENIDTVNNDSENFAHYSHSGEKKGEKTEVVPTTSKLLDGNSEQTEFKSISKLMDAKMQNASVSDKAKIAELENKIASLEKEKQEKFISNLKEEIKNLKDENKKLKESSSEKLTSLGQTSGQAGRVPASTTGYENNSVIQNLNDSNSKPGVDFSQNSYQERADIAQSSGVSSPKNNVLNNKATLLLENIKGLDTDNIDSLSSAIAELIDESKKENVILSIKLENNVYKIEYNNVTKEIAKSNLNESAQELLNSYMNSDSTQIYSKENSDMKQELLFDEELVEQVNNKSFLKAIEIALEKTLADNE